VPAERVRCDVAAVVPVRSDHRSIFVVPWGDQVYLGTTDTAWTGSVDEPDALPDDVDYLLDAANAVLTAPITRADVTGVWAGLRPLLAPSDGHRHRRRTTDLSRRHRVSVSPHGVVTVTGGKLTTYRKMAQDTVDTVLRSAGLPRRPCVTKSLRLRGATGTLADGADPNPDSDPAASTAAHLASRYGNETPAVLQVATGRPELLEPLVPGLPYLGAEAVYAVRSEMATGLEDVLDRRTRAVLRDARATVRAAAAVAELIAPELGWSDGRAAEEAAGYAAQVGAHLDRAGLPSDSVGADQ
jgi:glycerol-3-phosphate dehydrogenase